MWSVSCVGGKCRMEVKYTTWNWIVPRERHLSYGGTLQQDRGEGSALVNTKGREEDGDGVGDSMTDRVAV